MKATKWLVKLFKQPMQSECRLDKSILQMGWIGLFVAMFLFVFQPFGTASYPGNKFVLALQFGLITFIIGATLQIIQLKFLSIEKDHPSWNFGKWLISSLIIIVFIATGNFIYINFLSGWDETSLENIIWVFINTLAIGIFPVAAIGLYNLKRDQRQHQDVASHIQPASNPAARGKLLRLPSLAGDDIQIHSNHLLFLEAMENYIIVHSESSGIEKQMIRNTMKQLEQILPESFMRCHRSYIVNLDAVNDVSGNAQGLVLTLKNFPDGPKVPVSRSFIEPLKKQLEQV